MFTKKHISFFSFKETQQYKSPITYNAMAGVKTICCSASTNNVRKLKKYFFQLLVTSTVWDTRYLQTISFRTLFIGSALYFHLTRFSVSKLFVCKGIAFSASNFLKLASNQPTLYMRFSFSV